MKKWHVVDRKTSKSIKQFDTRDSARDWNRVEGDVNWVVRRINPMQTFVPATPVPTVKKPVLNVVLVVDKSDSMSIHSYLAPEIINQQLDALKQSAYQNGISTYISLVEFHSDIDVKFSNVYHAAVPRYTDYKPDKMTNLIDAVFTAEELIKHRDGAKLLLVITDGGHNTTRKHNEFEFKQLVNSLSRNPKWTVTFLGPREVLGMMQSLGVEAGNTRLWEGGKEEFKQSAQVMVWSIGAYTSNVAQGKLSTKSFYEAEVKNTKAVNSLTPATGFTQHLIDKSSDISGFVTRVKGSYRPGDAYYELTKPEKIQLYKGLIIQDRNTGDLKVGAVREALGIPISGDANVHPGNLKGYKVFVESTSMNRKLVPGTTILVKQ